MPWFPARWMLRLLDSEASSSVSRPRKACNALLKATSGLIARPKGFNLGRSWSNQARIEAIDSGRP